ncbi:hypothetical protein C8R47DRAFT_517022 [Mycena vitilis]|nr:hypothetical protein C8R47DRAFT_517022 [Mycena vitilis]
MGRVCCTQIGRSCAWATYAPLSIPPIPISLSSCPVPLGHPGFVLRLSSDRTCTRPVVSVLQADASVPATFPRRACTRSSLARPKRGSKWCLRDSRPLPPRFQVVKSSWLHPPRSRTQRASASASPRARDLRASPPRGEEVLGAARSLRMLHAAKVGAAPADIGSVSAIETRDSRRGDLAEWIAGTAPVGSRWSSQAWTDGTSGCAARKSEGRWCGGQSSPTDSHVDCVGAIAAATTRGLCMHTRGIQVLVDDTDRPNPRRRSASLHTSCGLVRREG